MGDVGLNRFCRKSRLLLLEQRPPGLLGVKGRGRESQGRVTGLDVDGVAGGGARHSAGHVCAFLRRDSAPPRRAAGKERPPPEPEALGCSVLKLLVQSVARSRHAVNKNITVTPHLQILCPQVVELAWCHLREPVALFHLCPTHALLCPSLQGHLPLLSLPPQVAGGAGR